MAIDRSERVARNESRFREINEGLRNHLAKLPGEPASVPFVCECGVSSCTAMVELTLPGYEAVRANSRRFVVLTGHEIPEAEDVIERTDRYNVVEKRPDTGRIVDASDPRRAHGEPR